MGKRSSLFMMLLALLLAVTAILAITLVDWRAPGRRPQPSPGEDEAGLAEEADSAEEAGADSQGSVIGKGSALEREGDRSSQTLWQRYRDYWIFSICSLLLAAAFVLWLRFRSRRKRGGDADSGGS